MKSEIVRLGLMERLLSCCEVTERVWEEGLPLNAARPGTGRSSCFAGCVAERWVSLPPRLRDLLRGIAGGVGRVFALAG